jgi:F0F1-type ATP synthase membrane subunit c/vacuolar-type H+-ATPase subunit K
MHYHSLINRPFWRLLISFTIIFFGVSLKHPLSVEAQTLTTFSFDNFSTATKIAGQYFPVTISARDGSNNILTSFTNSVSLYDNTGTIYPLTTGNFTSGTWSGLVAITQSTLSTQITASYTTVSGNSSAFAVNPDTRIKFATIVSGNNQTGLVGTQLPVALTMKVVDPYNNALANQGVNFAITGLPAGSTNQTLSNYSATTDSSGNATTLLTLGRKAGTFIVTGSLTSGVTQHAQFFANAIAGPVASISIVPSVGIVPAGSYLPFSVIAYDQYTNTIASPPITWSLQNGGGTVDSTGVFYAGTTLGTYLNTVRATTAGIGTSASVTIVGAAGEAGGTATSGGVLLPTPIPTPPLPTPTIAAGILYDVQVDPSVIAALENAIIPLLAKGVDLFGNTVPGVTYSFDVTGTLGSILQTGAGSALLTTSAAGLGTVVVTATQGDITRTTTIAGSVGNGLNRRLIIEEVSSPQAVGVPFTISIAAKDTANNFVTDYQGPIVIADTTGTIDPAVIQPSADGIWYVQVVISLSHPEVSITAAGDGMVGVSNIFEVTGSPEKSQLGLGLGFGDGGGGGGIGNVLGASISAILDKLLLEKNLNRFTIFRYIGAGLAAGFGILGTSIGGGIMVSRGLEAIGRNPFAKSKLQFNLYASLVGFILAASLAVVASYLILQ